MDGGVKEGREGREEVLKVIIVVSLPVTSDGFLSVKIINEDLKTT